MNTFITPVGRAINKQTDRQTENNTNLHNFETMSNHSQEQLMQSKNVLPRFLMNHSVLPRSTGRGWLVWYDGSVCGPRDRCGDVRRWPDRGRRPAIASHVRRRRSTSVRARQTPGDQAHQQRRRGVVQRRLRPICCRRPRGERPVTIDYRRRWTCPRKPSQIVRAVSAVVTVTRNVSQCPTWWPPCRT